MLFDNTVSATDGGDKKHSDIATYRLNRPHGQLSAKVGERTMYKFIISFICIKERFVGLNFFSVLAVLLTDPV